MCFSSLRRVLLLSIKLANSGVHCCCCWKKTTTAVKLKKWVLFHFLSFLLFCQKENSCVVQLCWVLEFVSVCVQETLVMTFCFSLVDSTFFLMTLLVSRKSFAVQWIELPLSNCAVWRTSGVNKQTVFF